MNKVRKCPFSSSYGYTTERGRIDWLRERGLPENEEVSKNVKAEMDPTKPLYYWQLYSLLGTHRIRQIVEDFYRRVFNDKEDPAFQSAFSSIASLEHHVRTQTAYWIDTMGGGKAYHGGEYRLNFHHTHNADSVMNAQGAKRWMYHMGKTLCSFNFSNTDIRIKPCIVEFLRTKMKKYSKQHGWRFDESDFDFVKHDPEILAIREMELAIIYPTDVEKFDVKSLRSFLSNHNVDFSTCREKRELKDLVIQTLLSAQEGTNELSSKMLKTALVLYGKDYTGYTEKEELRALAVEAFKATYNGR